MKLRHYIKDDEETFHLEPENVREEAGWLAWPEQDAGGKEAFLIPRVNRWGQRLMVLVPSISSTVAQRAVLHDRK